MGCRTAQAAAAAFVFLTASTAQAQDRAAKPPPPGPVFETRYAPDLFHTDVIDPLNIAGFELGSETVVHSGLDALLREAQLPVKAVGLFAVALLDRAIAATGHELGHVALISRAGYHDYVMRVDSDDEALNLPELFVHALVPGRRLEVSLTEEDALDAETRFQGRALYEFVAAINAGGLNQSQIHLSFLRRRVFQKAFGYLDTIPYVIEAISTLSYSGGTNLDLDEYVDSLETLGRETSIAQIRWLSTVRFISGSAIGVAAGVLGVVRDGDYGRFGPRVLFHRPEWSLYAPEFESYLTRRGPTIRAILPVRWTDFEVSPSLERSFAVGGAWLEAGLIARKPVVAWLETRGAAFWSDRGGRWLELGIDVKPHSSLAITLGWHIADRYTFRRDVYGSEYDFIEGDEQGLKFGLAVQHRF